MGQSADSPEPKSLIPASIHKPEFYPKTSSSSSRLAYLPDFTDPTPPNPEVASTEQDKIQFLNKDVWR
ncbi:hypothetical protein FF1_040575 [Malus domestica]